MIPHDFGTGSGIIKEIGKYAYKKPIHIYREAVANALDQYEVDEKNKLVEIKTNVPPSRDIEIIDHATGIQDLPDFMKVGSDEGKKVGKRISSYTKIDPEITGQKHIGKISFIFASQTENVEFHSNNGDVGMILVMTRAGFEPTHKDSTKVLPEKGLKVVIKEPVKELMNERAIIDYLSKVFAIRIARGAKILVNGVQVLKPVDFNCSHEIELFRLAVRDSEGKPIIVKGQLNHVSKPKPNNVDTFVKHVYVESDNYEYKVEGWINLDNFELEIGRNKVYEDGIIYPEFKKKFYEYLDANFEKTSKTVEKDIRGIKQLEEMTANLIKHFCELNPEMIKPLISGSKSRQGVAGKSPANNDVDKQQEWNVTKGVVDTTNTVEPTTAVPVGDRKVGFPNGTVDESPKREAGKIPIILGPNGQRFLAKSTGELYDDSNAQVTIKFVKLATNQDDPVIYYQPPNRIVINTARPSAEIILGGNPNNPAGRAMVLPLLTMAVIDMFPSASQLSSQEWKKMYGQLLDKEWAT